MSSKHRKDKLYPEEEKKTVDIDTSGPDADSGY